MSNLLIVFSQKSCDLLLEISVCGGSAVSYKEKAEFFAPRQVCIHDFGEGREIIYKQFVAKIFGDKGHYFQKKIIVGHGYSARYNIADEFLFFARDIYATLGVGTVKKYGLWHFLQRYSL